MMVCFVRKFAELELGAPGKNNAAKNRRNPKRGNDPRTPEMTSSSFFTANTVWKLI